VSFWGIGIAVNVYERFRMNTARRVKKYPVVLSKKERKAYGKELRASVRQEPTVGVIPVGFLRQSIAADVIDRQRARVGGVTPVMPSQQVDTAEGRLAWKAWKAREARVTVPVYTKAKAKQARDGRSDREIWYQHYKCWGVRGAK